MADSPIKTRITEAMKSAMRAQQKERLSTIRLMQAEFKRIEVDERIELDDARVLLVLDKMLKQRRDSIAQFEGAGRQKLADKEKAEMDVIREFMPTQLSADEIVQAVGQAIADCKASSAKDIGKVMGVLKPMLQGKADLGQVSKLVKTQLDTAS